MRAIVWNGERLLLNTAMPIPAPAADEALVRVRLAGICRTDLEILRGYGGFRGVLGHEFVGEVTDCAREQWIGRRVTADINVGCGLCHACRTDLPKLCDAGDTVGIRGRNGVFAEYVLLPLDNLVPVPDEVDDMRAVFAEPLAAACSVLEHARIEAGQPAVVIGAGKLGLLVAQALRAAGAEVILVIRHPAQRRIAADLGLNATMEEGAPHNVPLVIEASASDAGLALALDIVAPRGMVVVKSTVATRPEIDMNKVVLKEVRLVGSLCGDLRHALELMRRRAVQLAPLISQSFPLHRWQEAFARAAEPGTLKVLLSIAA